MKLPDYCQRVTMGRGGNKFRGSFRTAIVHNDDFETRRVRLPRQRLQTLIKRYPIVINGYDNAESRYRCRVLFALSHGPVKISQKAHLEQFRISHSTVKSKFPHGYVGYDSQPRIPLWSRECLAQNDAGGQHQCRDRPSHELYNKRCNPMINCLRVKSNLQFLAAFVLIGIVSTVQVGCTSCLITPGPTPAERLEAALRKAGTLASPPAVAPLVCPSFGSSSLPAASPVEGEHRVILSWRASAPADSKHAAAAGYCIYRGLMQKDPSPVLLNTTPFPGTSCADDSVVNDKKYYYVVRAISDKGVPSIISNEAPAAIPKHTDPSASRISPPLCREPVSTK